MKLKYIVIAAILASSLTIANGGEEVFEKQGGIIATVFVDIDTSKLEQCLTTGVTNCLESKSSGLSAKKEPMKVESIVPKDCVLSESEISIVRETRKKCSTLKTGYKKDKCEVRNYHKIWKIIDGKK